MAGSAFLALRSPRVQTAAVALVTERLSQALQVQARIDRVELKLPLDLQLQNVYLSDQQGDTLLSIPSLRARLSLRALRTQCLRFPLIELNQPVIRLVQGEDYTNIDFLIQLLHTDSPQSDMAYKIDCQQVHIHKARVRYRHLPSNTDLYATDLSTTFAVAYLTDRTLSARLRQLHVRAGLSSLDGYVEADLHGSLDTICADRLCVTYRDQLILDGHGCVQHPMSKEWMHADVHFTDLCANAYTISSLISDITHQPAQLPVWVYQLGNMHYRGQVSGRMNDWDMHGSFLTRLGSITTKAHVQNMRNVHASVATSNMQLGRFLQVSDLGALSAACTVDLVLDQSMPTDMDVSAEIYGLDFKGYTYHNIRLNGRYTLDQCEAHLYSFDPRVSFVADADIRGIGQSPEVAIDLRANRLDLVAMHLSDPNSAETLSFRTTVRLHMDSTISNRIDATVGRVDIDSIFVSGQGRVLAIPKMEAVLTADGNQRHLNVQSVALKANVDGRFSWSTLPATLQQMAHRCLPSLINQPKGRHDNNDLDFQIEVLRADELCRLFMPTMPVFPSAPVVSGFVHESDNTFSVDMHSPQIKYNNSSFQDIDFSINNLNPKHEIVGGLSLMQRPVSADSARLRLGDLKAEVEVRAHQDSITTAISFGPVANFDSLPDVLVHTTVQRELGEPVVSMHVLPTSFQLGTELWRVKESHVRYAKAKQTLSVDSLMFFTPHQMLMLNGRLSSSYSDSIRVQINDVDLGYLLAVTRVVDVVDFRGNITGWATLYGAYSSPQFEANLSVPDGSINGVPLGEVTAKAELDRATKQIMINGRAVRDNICIADVKGTVMTSQLIPSWDIQIEANGVPLNFVDYWTKDIVNHIEGFAYGRVHIYGEDLSTWVTTRAYVKDGGITVPATGARYYFSDSIIMDTASISFPSIHLHDAMGHKGHLSGLIQHHQFKDFQFRVDANCDQLLAIDLPASSGSTYYGRVYASGDVSIAGDELETQINVTASTAENTDFYLSLATASSASSSEFITFRQPQMWFVDTTASSKPRKFLPSSRLYLNLAVDVRPTARVHLVLDSQNGDGIVGRGEGNLRLGMDATTGEIQMFGSYALRSGTFSYTVGNLMHRDFAIAEGSTITWAGDATNPQLNIIAKYRCTASLRDLFGADAKNITSRSSIPVDCVVRITGEMNNMVLKFGIEYPQSDESVSAQINSVINTEAMLMRQVVYLLVFNRFYTPEYLRTDISSSLNDAYSLLSSTVTGQINSWLSKLTSMVNVGFNMRTDGQMGNQSYETEANIQIQPIDRLTINGNVGYRYNDLTNQPIFGDADVEYELTADGKLRAKAFTHSVDQYSLHQSGMQSGIGLIFRHDFNPGDAKKRREQKKLEKK